MPQAAALPVARLPMYPHAIITFERILFPVVPIVTGFLFAYCGCVGGALDKARCKPTSQPSINFLLSDGDCHGVPSFRATDRIVTSDCIARRATFALVTIADWPAVVMLYRNDAMAERTCRDAMSDGQC